MTAQGGVAFPHGLLAVLPNPVRRPHFVAGDQVRAFRRGRDSDPAAEDWTTSDVQPRSSTGSDEVGLGRVEAGGGSTTVRDLIAKDPVQLLGPGHGAEEGLGYLVKLFNPDRRIPVHAHPTRKFAAERLHRPGAGKTEAWIVLQAEGPGPHAWLGFDREIGRDELDLLIARQEPIVDRLVPLTLAAGDVVFVPAGLPHSMGTGVLAIEPQEPTDWSILAEHRAFDLPESAAYLGLTRAAAIDAFDRRAWTREQIEEAFVSRGVLQACANGVTEILAIASEFFRVEVVVASEAIEHEPGAPCTLIVTRGSGVLTRGTEHTPVAAGDVLFAPSAGGTIRLDPREGLQIVLVGAPRHGEVAR